MRMKRFHHNKRDLRIMSLLLIFKRNSVQIEGANKIRDDILARYF